MLAWRRLPKTTIFKRWLSTCRPEPMVQECHSITRTMNDVPAPIGTWIARHYMKEHTLKAIMWTGFGVAAISLATMIHTNATWLGKNFQYITGFDYADAAKQAKQPKKVEEAPPPPPPPEETIEPTKLEEVQYFVDEPSSGPFFILSALFAIASLTKLVD